MADYPLPQQNVAQIGQTASNVPPNVLGTLGSGIAVGSQMGFQARQIAALEQERNTQQMAAQAAAQQAKRANDLAALDSLSTQYERLSKNHPDTAFEFYRDKMAPFYSSVLQDHGIQADFQSEANPLHETSDSVKRINDAVTGLSDGSIQMPEFQKIMSKEQSGHNVGEYLQKRIDEAQKAGNTVQNYNKDQSDLFQSHKAELDKQLSNRGGGLGAQDAKVNQAVHLRTMINQNTTIDPVTKQPVYHFPQNVQAEMVLGLANLMSGSNMSSVEQMQSLTPKTMRNSLAQTASYWAGVPFDATPQAFAKQLVDQIDRQGQTAQQIRDTYQGQFVQSLDPRINAENKQKLVNSVRGVRFEDFSPGGKNAPKKSLIKPGTVEGGYRFTGGDPSNPKSWVKQ